MKRHQTVIAVLLHGACSAVFACAGLQRGEIDAAPAHNARDMSHRTVVASQHHAADWARALTCEDAGSSRFAADWRTFTPDVAARRTAGGDNPIETLQEIPPAPSSFSLGLTALAGLGLYHASRSVRKLQLSQLPDWYHAGGPAQVGHATPIDLDVDTASLPLCVHALPTPYVPRLIRFAVEAITIRPLEYTPITVAPRGPPATSSSL